MAILRTPRKNLPYPSGAEPLSNADSHLQQLAEALDAQPKIVTGVTNVTTDANGAITITHGLGYAPQVVLATSSGSAHTVHPGTPTSTTFSATVRSVTAAGAVIANSAVTIRWAAIG